MKVFLKILLLISCIFFTSFVEFRKEKGEIDILSQKKRGEDQWVDEIYKGLSLKQKIGQLFMVPASIEGGKENSYFVEDLIKNHEIGGVIFMKKWIPQRQAKFTNYCQSISKIPLMIAIDAEWGLDMRLENTFRFPWNLTLGAIKNDGIILKVGESIGKHCRDMGININFAPDVDLNTNYKNPIIGNRSFGGDRLNVYKKALSIIRGMEKENVMTVIKHFPGHGDTDQDSHKSIPVINKTKKNIYKEELYPFRRLVKDGVSGVMVGHLKVPSIDDLYPATLSNNIINGVLKKEIKFKGLVFTDALNMGSVSESYQIGELELLALLAGNDILVLSKSPQKAIEYLVNKIEKEGMNINIIEEKVRKVLKYKYRMGLNIKPEVIDTNNIIARLNTLNDTIITQYCYEEALTILKNEDKVIPIRFLNYQKIGLISIGENNHTFKEYIDKYANVNFIDYNDIDFISQIEKMTVIILSVHKSDKTPWESFILTEKEKKIITDVAKRKKTILCLFGSPYGLIDFEQENLTKSTFIAYQNNYYSQKVMAQMIFGALGVKGKLPIDINDRYKINTGLTVKPLNILSYGYPEMVGMDTEKLSKIDSIMNKAINNKYIPGAQILVAKKGKVIYSNNFGYQYYDSINKVDDNTIYDLASITKMISTTLILMYLEDLKILNVEEKIGDIIPELKNTNKENITVKEILAHNSGLISWYPFYKKIIKNKNIDTKWVSEYKRNGYEIEVARNIYLRNDIEDSLRHWIYNTKINTKKYAYSDIGFFILGDVIKKKLENPNFEKILYEKFYYPLGAYRVTYNPLEKFNISEIAPSENDNYFRNTIVEGYTNDVIACMEKTTPTHAGLFSNANDLAKLGQMLLQKGNYGNIEYVKSKTISKFNKVYFKDNRRGLGFDKPEYDVNKEKMNILSISEKSFGHTGFTGTMIWIDPQTEVLYIFLSNRTYPSIDNNNLSKNNIRVEIQNIIYNSLI